MSQCLMSHYSSKYSLSLLIGKFQLKRSYAINQLHKSEKPDITKQQSLDEYRVLMCHVSTYDLQNTFI